MTKLHVINNTDREKNDDNNIEENEKFGVYYGENLILSRPSEFGVS